MALFQKKAKDESESQEAFSEYVDSLLDEDQTTSEQALKPAYGIDQAIELMRKVPKDNPDVVVAVIRETLSSANIDVDAIIADAENKTESLRGEIAGLRDRISALQEEIQEKEADIQRSQQDLQETARVQELLKASIQNSQQGKAKTAEPSVSSQQSNSEPEKAQEQLAGDQKIAS